MNSEIKGIILDYGGTLDSRGCHWSHIIYHGWKNAGLDIAESCFRDVYIHAERLLEKEEIIRTSDNFYELMFKKIEIELKYLQKSSLHCFGCQADLLQHASKIAGFCYDYARGCIEEVRPLLKTLHDRFPMALVSNFYGNIDTVLNDFKIRAYFRKVIDSTVVGIRKPDPEIFRMGVQSLSLPPANVLVVGDSLSKDIRPALKVGCHAVWLKGKGWSDNTEFVPCTVRVIDKLSMLLPILAPTS